jgi:hypothetical protein
MQLVLIRIFSIKLLIRVDVNYISKVRDAIKKTMLKSSRDPYIRILKYLNATNAILSKKNA